MSIRQQVIFV